MSLRRCIISSPEEGKTGCKIPLHWKAAQSKCRISNFTRFKPPLAFPMVLCTVLDLSSHRYDPFLTAHWPVPHKWPINSKELSGPLALGPPHPGEAETSRCTSCIQTSHPDALMLYLMKSHIFYSEMRERSSKLQSPGRWKKAGSDDILCRHHTEPSNLN